MHNICMTEMVFSKVRCGWVLMINVVSGSLILCGQPNKAVYSRPHKQAVRPHIPELNVTTFTTPVLL